MTDMNECIADTVSESDVLPAIRKNYEALIDEVRGQNENVRIMAVTKTQSVEKINYLIENCGLALIGENRVNELLDKYDRLAKPHGGKLEIHFIGTLQKNKVKYIVGRVSLIESVDCLELLEAINKKAASLGVVQDILLEVNIGAEEAKSGFSPESLMECLPRVGEFSCIRVRGLMAIPPICEKTEEIRPYFRAMKQLFVDIGAKKYDNVSMDFLSMGMSADYMTAIEEGANIVRVGTGIFGARHY